MFCSHNETLAQVNTYVEKIHFGVYGMNVEKGYSYGCVVIPGIKTGDIAIPIRIMATAVIDVAVIWFSLT